MSRMRSSSDIFFGLVAMAAVACFIGLLVLQILEYRFYKEDPIGGQKIWPQVTVRPPPIAPPPK